MPSRTHNPEKRAWRGKSHKKGGERVRALREVPEKPVKRVGPKLSAVPVTPSTDMTTTELVRTLRDRGVQGDIEGFVETADEDEIRELLRDLRVWANPPKVMFWDFNTGRHTYSEAEAKAWREDGGDVRKYLLAEGGI